MLSARYQLFSLDIYQYTIATKKKKKKKKIQ